MPSTMRDVVVERRDLAVDARGERAHGQGAAALLVDEVERGAHELLAFQAGHESPRGSSVAVIRSVTCTARKHEHCS
jgi:hypothetical protein